MSQLLAQTQPTFFSPHLTLFLQICAAIAGVGVAVRTIYSFYCFVHSGYERRKEKVNKAFGLLGAILFEGFKPIVLCFMAFGFRRSDIAFYQRFYWFSLGLFALLISATIWFDWMRRHNR